MTAKIEIFGRNFEPLFRFEKVNLDNLEVKKSGHKFSIKPGQNSEMGGGGSKRYKPLGTFPKSSRFFWRASFTSLLLIIST